MNIAFPRDPAALADPQTAAAFAGLVYVSDDDPGIRRRRAGKGFFYLDAKGRKIADRTTLARIRALAIPPAWTDVWISPDPDGHLQATGRDAKGRKQYRYHAHFREARDGVKYDRLFDFAEGLPALRARIAQDMARRGLPREKVLATVVDLLEKTLIRIGNPDYARQNESYGLTTLLTDHVEVDGTALRFSFKGKSGKQWNLQVRDRRIARVVKACQELPGQNLFGYVDEDGETRAVTSADVNAYLREAAGRDISAKDVRTWAGTVAAAMELAAVDPPTSAAAAKKQQRAAIARVAAKLGNTVAVCRSCYVHPAVLDLHASGALAGAFERPAAAVDGLSPSEATVLALLCASDVTDAVTDVIKQNVDLNFRCK